MADSVNHPSHYNQGNIEVIDAIDDWKLNFALGNVVKYVAQRRPQGARTGGSGEGAILSGLRNRKKKERKR